MWARRLSARRLCTTVPTYIRNLHASPSLPFRILISPPDPGFCNTNLRMVHVKIDTSLPENQNLKPELEENEFIEVFYVKLTDLWAECKKLEAEGCAIDARVATIAEGIELAKRWRL
jgi:hypothetical protein